jgi:hypothetical protein
MPPFFVPLSQASSGLSNGTGGVVIGVRERQIRGWQWVLLAMNQLLGSATTGFWTGEVPEIAEAVK